MRPRGWSAFWTILAAVAGVVGAAAAVYPLLNTEQQLAHLSYDDDLTVLRVETFSEPVILTGGWQLKKGQWWANETLQAGDVVIVFADTRVPANDRKALFLDKQAIEKWVGQKQVSCRTGRTDGVPCWEFVMAPCPEHLGELEIGLEFRSKSGLSWARRKLPYCIRVGVYGPPASDPADAYWKGVPGAVR